MAQTGHGFPVVIYSSRSVFTVLSVYQGQITFQVQELLPPRGSILREICGYLVEVDIPIQLLGLEALSTRILGH